MVLDWFAFGVQQIIETNEKCVTIIIADNGRDNCSLFTVHVLLKGHENVFAGIWQWQDLNI